MNNKNLQDNINPADAPQKQDTQEVSKEIDTLKNRVVNIAFSLSYLLNPEAAILNFTDFENGNYETWYRNHFESLAQKVADKFNVDVEQVIDKETRTPEQDKELTLLAGEYIMQCFTKFKESNYFQAKTAIRQEKVEFASEEFKGLENVKTAATLYFFAIHPEIDPEDKANLTQENIKELKTILYDMEKYYDKEVQFEQLLEGYGKEVFFKYIEKNSPSFEKTIETAKLITKKIHEIEYPLDKVNSKLWGLQPGKQVPLKAEKDESEEQANIYVMLDFDELQNNISRPLTYYDKKVFLSVCNLKNNGNDIVTTTQIYKAMGNKSRPATSDREKILKSLKVMSMCRVSLDNTEEANLYPKYDKVKTDFYLLPTTIIEGYKNHHVIDDAIHILELPKLFIFSKNRKQITKAPIELLESPISQTEANLQLEDYLLRRIAQMKNKPEISKTIVLETIYENCNINDRLKKSRLPDKLTRILGHWKKIKWIKGYTIDDRCIKIAL